MPYRYRTLFFAITVGLQPLSQATEPKPQQQAGWSVLDRLKVVWAIGSGLFVVKSVKDRYDHRHTEQAREVDKQVKALSLSRNS